MQTTVQAQLIEIGNLGGPSDGPSALFQCDGKEPALRIPLTIDQAQELAKHLYSFCEIQVLITPDTQYRSSRKRP